MAETTPQTVTKPKLALPVVVGAVILVIFGGFFVVEFALSSLVGMDAAPVPASADAYRERVDALLVNANPANGEAALERYQCLACHRYAGETVAPQFTGIAQRAAQRRPPMPADAYLYESIVNPGAYVIEGYANSMIQNFESQISDQELGDIIAYLLTSDAH